MLLIFNHAVTMTEKETKHGAHTLPSMVHIAFEIGADEYEKAKKVLSENNIRVENETVWENEIKSRSIYFRDSAGNLLEFITRNYWGVID